MGRSLAAAAARKLRNLPGRYNISSLDGDSEWRYYWHAFLGDDRVNGGVGKNYDDAVDKAKRAISIARYDMLTGDHYFDTETATWVLKGELPPVS